MMTTNTVDTRTPAQPLERGGPAQPPRRPRGGWAEAVPRWFKIFLLWIPLIALVLWTVVPFLVTVGISFKTRGDVFGDPGIIPWNPTLGAYEEVLSRPSFRGAFLNSVIVGFGTAVLTVAIAIPASYAFARFGFRGRHLLLLFTLLPRLIPTIGLMVPLYQLAVTFGLIDRRMTLIIVYTGMLLPLAVWLLVGFIQQIPRELEEAANVDGASLWQRMRFVVLPLSTPALITIGVLAFREAWNEFQLVLVLTTTPGKRTLPYELYLMQGIQGIQNYPAEAAFTILTVLPFILVYTRIEKYIVAGITTGSVK